MKSSNIGGQAVMEGIMMRSGDQYSIGVRKPDGEIEVKVEPYRSWAKDSSIWKLPVFRGVASFFESLVVGIRCLMYSASFIEDEEEDAKKPGKEKTEEQKEKEREVEEKEQSEAANTDRIVLPEQEEAAQNPDGEEQQEEGEATEHAKETPAQTDAGAEQTAAEGTAAYFSEEDTLLWPVDGNVIMNYSMDQSIYFATLDQYKYNPAVVISGQVGAEVKAAAAGTVSAVDTNAQTGTTVSIDMGNGYAAIYGQLKEVPVQPGEYVTENSVIGYVSEPTKYYSVEGPNLYFQLLKDGQPVNPMDHIAYE